MFLVRMIRKLFSLLRSNLTAHEIALGFCLGLLGGCIPVSSIWAFAAVLLIMLAVRASFSTFLVALILVKLLGKYILLPICFSLGEFALDGPLSGIFAFAAGTPGLALLDPHRYVVAGALLFSILASIPVYPILYLLVNRYRSAILGWNKKSPAYRAVTSFFLVRFLTWLFMGKKGDFAAALETHRSFFRKGALLLGACFAAVIWITSFLFGDSLTGMGLEAGLSAAMDTEVYLEDTKISFLRGKLAIAKLRVLEDEKKGEITEVAYFEGDLHLGELLRRHLVFDKIEMGKVRFNARRDAEGRFNLGEPRRKKDRKPDDAVDEEAWMPHVGDLWDQKELARDIVEKVLDWIFPPTDPEEAAALRDEKKKRILDEKRYLDAYAMHLIDKEQPLVVINELWIRGLDLLLEDKGSDRKPEEFKGLTLHATNLSSNPVLHGKVSRIELFTVKDWDSAGFRLRLNLNWQKVDPVHALDIDLLDLPSESLTERLSRSDRFVVSGGALTLKSRSNLDTERFGSTNELSLRNLAFAPGKKGESILGLDAELFCTGMTEYFKSNPLTLKAGIIGAYTSPRLEINEEELLRVVAEGIKNTGRQVLIDELERQKGKLIDEIEEEKDKLKQKGQEKIDEAAKEVQEEVNEKIKKGLDDIFGRKKKDRNKK